MFSKVSVDSRVSIRHPELLDTDIKSAWYSAFIIVERCAAQLPDSLLIAVGSDAKGRLIEMVAITKEDGTTHIFHTTTPPSKTTLLETGLGGAYHDIYNKKRSEDN